MGRAAAKDKKVVREWLALPGQLERRVRGLSKTALAARRGAQSLSVRETIHHVVESNLVAAGILHCALATDGGTYDWTWVWPNAAWMQRLGYDRAPVGAAIGLLRALTRHFAVLLAVNDDALRRKVKLFDRPGARKYVKSVEQVLAFEVARTREHLADLPPRRARR